MQRSRALAWVVTVAGGLVAIVSLLYAVAFLRSGALGQTLICLLIAGLSGALSVRMSRVGLRFNRLLKDPDYLMSRQIDQEELLTAQSGTFLPWKEWRQ